MRTPRLLAAAALLAGTALAVLAGPAAADDPTGTPTDTGSASATATATAGDDDAAPTEAGTNFRTATVIRPGQRATAGGSAGDYLYWAFPADTGQNATVTATVAFPAGQARHGSSTWQVDVYDGLRRRQACRYGAQTRVAAADAASVELVCHLRTVRAWAEPWSNDPLRGAFYIRLAVLDLPQTDLGLPVQAAVEATTDGTAGRQAVDGSAVPLVTAAGPRIRPSGGWAGTWWSPRWLWTAGGGVLAVLAALGAHRLARGPVRLPGAPRPPREPVRETPPYGGAEPYGGGQPYRD
ncbi:hypothetical protein VSR01_00910 [Actinacidiphila sp. DG2A-62]|uniref:hypothetical protein n=1 Tax=Actinacidiphila sp. DG2A-62 TaxID=3108821 RepID=UPI002DBD874F|nr:hypothetical protein [Actinacidiphila sp. DG2A-62]MEC3992182.1 hypothetical protein [Actinacidiphila sp. DG2A-62]